jgi:hypothetical protein
MRKNRVCNRFFTMGQWAGSRVATGRFQAMGQTAFTLVHSPTKGAASARNRPRYTRLAPCIVTPRGSGTHVDQFERTKFETSFSRNRLKVERNRALSSYRHTMTRLETQTFEKPVFHVTGSRVETRRFQAMGQLNAKCTAPQGLKPGPFTSYG